MECKLFFTGDFVISQYKNQKNILSDQLKEKIKNCDIKCCNFEGPIIQNNYNKQRKIGPNIFNNEEIANIAIKDGFNLFCIANNHIFDYGEQGMKKTIKYFKEKKVDYVGADLEKNKIYEPILKNINNQKICIINVAENGFGAAVEDDKYGYAYMLHEKVLAQISKYSSIGYSVILICHAGVEHVEIPLPEIRNLYKKYIDFGAELVIAHHPHVVQGWEKYKGKEIFYSLGNFAFDRGMGAQNTKSFSLLVTIKERNIYTEIVNTEFNGKEVDIIENKEKNSYLYEILNNSDKYEELLKEKISEEYKKFKTTYERINVIYKGNIKERMKGFIKKYILRVDFQDIWLYHNINIESHLWLMQRGSRMVLKKQKIL